MDLETLYKDAKAFHLAIGQAQKMDDFLKKLKNLRKGNILNNVALLSKMEDSTELKAFANIYAE